MYFRFYTPPMDGSDGNRGGFQLEGRNVGVPNPPLVIGEVAQAHDGSLGVAHAFIDALADAGADGVKFQTHIADEESSPEEQWRVRFSTQDETRMDYWRRMEFTPPQWQELKKHADDRGLIFLSSAFSLAAVELLAKLGLVGWKVASGELTNERLLEAMLATEKPILLSSGMATLAEMDRAVKMIRKAGSPMAVFQCTSKYPTPSEQLGLNLITELQAQYDCPVGLSDHSGTIYPSLGAVVLGASLLEVHVTFSEAMFGPDVSSSVTFRELRQLVDGVQCLSRAMNNPVDKDQLAADLGPLRKTFQQSLVATVDLSAGTELTRGNTSLRKPCYGIPSSSFFETMGRRVNRPIQKGEFIKDADIQSAE